MSSSNDAALGGTQTFPLDLLPVELRILIYHLALENTTPRIFELEMPSASEANVTSAGPRVVPNKGLRPPPILHAIPEARRELTSQFVTAFHNQPAGDHRSEGDGWLFHSRIDMLFFKAELLEIVIGDPRPFTCPQRVAFFPYRLHIPLFQLWAAKLAEWFPDLRTLIIVNSLISSTTQPTSPYADKQLVMADRRHLKISTGGPSLPEHTGSKTPLDSFMANEFGAKHGRDIVVECRMMRKYRGPQPCHRSLW